jgi:hypothetical protein
MDIQRKLDVAPNTSHMIYWENDTDTVFIYKCSPTLYALEIGYFKGVWVNLYLCGYWKQIEGILNQLYEMDEIRLVESNIIHEENHDYSYLFNLAGI